MHDDIPTTAALLRGLASALRGRLDDVNDWTYETFRAASRLLAPRKCMPHAARRRPGDGWCPEYLVDMCLTDDTSVDQNDPDDPFTYRRLLLALECEWAPSRNALKYDFCKLADVRSSRRLFVGYVRHSDDGSRLVEDAARFLKGHQLVEEADEYGVLLFVGTTPTPLAWLVTKTGAASESIA